MKLCSKVLLDLYATATHTAPKTFTEALIHLVRRYIMFDGALYGSGLGDRDGNLIIERDFVYQRPKSLRHEYAPLLTIDPIAQAITGGLSSPFSCFLQTYVQNPQLSLLQQIATRYQIKNLLVYGYPPALERPGRWLALFRAANLPFSRTDGLFLKALWPHLFQSIELNLFYTLHNTQAEQANHASGLINAHGVTEAADPKFVPLLQTEWPDHRGRNVPRPIISTVVRDGVFHGRSIDLTGMPHSEYLMCTAHRAPMNHTLSVTETTVAHCFARGMTNTEIALKLGTSPHTVRVQLKSVYLKLGVHSKIDLAHAIT
ncbi:MAG: helix-turn-helix transcriptional regulator [Herminiimonas sp.]|nr:helix-turn-helix transcriptional regulator [Herminiimonas sp.]